MPAMLTGCLLFALAAAGFLAHRNIIMLLMFAELMLNAADLVLVASPGGAASPEPQIFVLAAFAVAAAETGVGLAVIILLARRTKNLKIDAVNGLKD